MEATVLIVDDEGARTIPAIFITPKEDMGSVVQGFPEGGVDHITKPFQAEEVLAAVEAHLKISQLTHALQRKKLIRRRCSASVGCVFAVQCRVGLNLARRRLEWGD